MVALNPEAPEFFPSHTNKLQQQLEPLPCSPCIFSPIPNCYYYTWSRQFHPFYFSPTIHPPPFFPSHDAAIANPVAVQNYPNPVQAHAVLQKKDEVAVLEAKTCGSKGVVQKQVYKAFISCGTLDGHRSDSLRLKGYYPRGRKAEENGQRRTIDYSRNRKVSRHPVVQCFRAYPKRKPCYPSLPVRVDENETTVMIRNIPSKYTRKMLVEFLDHHCMKVNTKDKEADEEESEESSALAFDFVYLPIDFQSGMNKGYAFVNFTKPQAALKFRNTASHMKWDFFESHKIREVVSARLQGKEKLEKHFETMNFPYESEDVLPVCFSPPRDGVIQGEQRTMGNLMKRERV